ncbi:MAG TPA: DUF1330 domain-containing protein [Gemmatimonadales bacterium]|nr:DUF1330 domain-containing protein [Gemmatimonadales bacterium]
MPKGYWLTIYRSVSDPARLAAYAALATPAIEAGGGRILARGVAVRTFEGRTNERTVVVEFPSVQQAVATYEGQRYQDAARLLVGAVDREVRIVEGVG